MTSLKQQEKATKILDVIEKEQKVTLYDALDLAGLSMAQWFGNGFAGWFKYRYGELGNKTIKFDSKTNTFYWNKKGSKK